MKILTRILNDWLEASEKERKDELKKRREEGIQPASIKVSVRSQGVCLLARLRLAWSTTSDKDMTAQHRSSTSAHSVANLSTSRGSPCTRGIAQ